MSLAPPCSAHRSAQPALFFVAEPFPRHNVHLALSQSNQHFGSCLVLQYRSGMCGCHFPQRVSLNDLSVIKINSKQLQVCIPVGCVRPASVAATRCQYRGSLFRVDLCPGGSLLEVALPKRWLYPEGSLSRGRPPPSPVDRMTDASKNITLPQTSFAGGNKSMENLHSP